TNFLLSTRARTPGQDGYGFFLNNNEKSIGIVDMAVGGNLTVSFFPLATGIDYMLEAKSIGTTLSLAVWEADGVPPANPQIVIENDLYSEGQCAAIIYNHPTTLGGTGGVLDATFDDFTFSPAGTV